MRISDWSSDVCLPILLDAAGERPVIFRTVDIGGDKALPYMRQDNENNEDNPAMGWRALRLSLERDGLMKAQVRAVLAAAAGRTLYVMFTLVSEPLEFDAVKALFKEQPAWLTDKQKQTPLERMDVVWGKSEAKRVK